MTQGFDLDEIERLLAATKYVFSHVEDYAEAVEAYHAGLRKASPAMLTEIRELRAENARLREAMKGPLAWLERWAVHVGNCETNPECTCGLMFAQHELRAALGEPQ